MDPSGLTQRLAALPGAGALDCLRDFDPHNDLHVDAAACLLIGRFHASNDVEALALLYEIAHRRLREIARQICRQLAVALDPEDLLAGFMTRLFTDVRRPQPPVHHFLGLAHTAMRNDARNQLRQNARAWRRMLAYHSMQSEPADPLREADDHEEQQSVARLGLLLLLVVGQCFHALSARDRAALLLREVDGLAYEQLAQSLRIPANQVGSVLRRARQRLLRKVGAALLRDGRGSETP